MSRAPTRWQWHELFGAAPIVLSIVLLPIGRTVEISTATLALLGIGVLLKPKYRSLLPKTPSRQFSLVFACIWLPMAASLCSALRPEVTLSTVIQYSRFYFAGIWLLFWLRDPQRSYRLWQIISWIVLVWLLDSLWQWLSGSDILGRVYDNVRLTGPFKDFKLPIVLILLLPMTLAWLHHTSRTGLFWFTCGLALLVLALSGQRAVWLDLILASTVFASMLRWRKAHFHPVIGLLLVVAIALTSLYQISAGFQERVDRTLLALNFDYQAINIASAYRLPIWDTGWRMIKANSVTGIGVKNFRHAYGQYALANDRFVLEAGADEVSVYHPHLFMLEIAAETGLLGILGFLFVLILLTLYLWRHKSAPVFLPALVTLAVFFFPFNAHVAFYGSFYSQLLWWLVAAILAALYHPKPRIKPNSRSKQFHSAASDSSSTQFAIPT